MTFVVGYMTWSCIGLRFVEATGFYSSLFEFNLPQLPQQKML